VSLLVVITEVVLVVIAEVVLLYVQIAEWCVSLCRNVVVVCVCHYARMVCVVVS
jgi:hypothetical protein